jgi:5'-nucleotidase
MNILIANVANLESNELRVLAAALAKNHKVTVCSMAAASHQKGNSFSYGGFPVKFKKIDGYEIDGEKIDAYKFYGTPADMIAIMLGCIMENHKPDLVICGINNGLTIGTDSFCSSNIGMAMESAFLGVPTAALAVPIKLGGHTKEELTNVARFIAKNIDAIGQIGLVPNSFLNISCPIVENYEDYKGVGIGSMDNLTAMTKYAEKVDCNGQKYYWTEFVTRESADGENAAPTSAMFYFQKNYIIISPLSVDSTDNFMIAKLQKAEKSHTKRGAKK